MSELFKSINRRHFLGSSIATFSSGVIFTDAALAFFGSNQGETYVFDILVQHLGLKEHDRTLVRPFISRLKTPGLHSETPEVFNAWIEKKGDYDENLAAYLVEEFVVATNYFSFKAGDDAKLYVLPAESQV